MKRSVIITSIILLCTCPSWGQGALDALVPLNSQLKGTARYSAMAGAFGALGGDLSTIKQNPAGLGIYRSSEVSVTAGFNFYNNMTQTDTYTGKNDGFTFSGDNLGFVGCIRFRNSALRTLNFGFAYNNIASFDNTYRADWDNISSSLTQLIAQKTDKINPIDLIETSNYNPYNSGAPWLSILGYNAFLINADPIYYTYSGIFNPAASSTGRAALQTFTRGSIDEYDLNISGNVSDILYWGVTLNVINIDYRLESHYGEKLQNAILYVEENNNSYTTTVNADYELINTLKTSGYGFGVKMGLICRPVSFIRLGLAFHTPNYYQLTDTYWAGTNYKVGDKHGTTDDNYTDVGSVRYELQSPWRIIGSAAIVLGKTGMINVDYEYNANKSMKYSADGADYSIENNNISSYMAATNIVRVGGEFKLLPQFSIRAGYAYESSPISNDIFNGSITPKMVEGTLTSFILPHDAHNISCGLGYRFNNISFDVAYVHRMQKYEIYPFISDNNIKTSLNADMDMRHNSIKATVSYRF